MNIVKKAKCIHIVISAILMAVGLCLILWPVSFASLICWFIGAVCVLIGVAKLIGYFSNDIYRLAFQFDLALGIFTILLGGFYDSEGRVLRFQPTEAELEADEAAERYLTQPAAEAWAVWDGCHDYKPQKDRRARARCGELMPDSVDRERKVATFIGGHNDSYTTTLLGCTCPDFAERGKPCKHMYWLAHELGLDDVEE